MATMLSAAAASGMPRDQTSRFVKGGYVVLEQCMSFHAAARLADLPDGPEEIALAGTRGSAKSRTVMSQVGLDDCQRVPNLKWLFLRKIMKTAAEALDDLEREVFRYTTHTFTEAGVEFPNGSRILVGGYKDERDIDKYLGLEYDGVVIEEATQFSEERKDRIYGSVRTSKPNWRPRKYLTTNADGIGLAWFKRTFVTPARERRETITRFFEVSYAGNPFLNPEYVRWLEGLKGQLAKAWRDCDWDAFAGMAFPTWNYERHVVPFEQTFEIPLTWMKWTGTDWGTAAPFCNLWLAKQPDVKRIYVYREAYQAGLNSTEQTAVIKDMTLPDEKIVMRWADPSMWPAEKMRDKVTSAVDDYKAAGLILTKGDNNRLSGKRKIDSALADLPDGKPGLMIFENCENLIEQLSSAPADPLNPEDIDTESEDHALDALKYALTNEKRVDRPRTPPRGNPLRNPRYRKVL